MSFIVHTTLCVVFCVCVFVMMSIFPECLVIYSAFHDYFSCLLPDLTLREYMTGDTCGEKGDHSSGTLGLTLDDSGVHVFLYFLCLCVCRSTLSMSPVCPFWLLHWYLFLNMLIKISKRKITTG